MDKATQLFGTLGKIVPELSDSELDRLIAFGQGLAFKVVQEKEARARSPASGQGEARPST